MGGRKIKCDECRRQMHKYNEQLWGKKRDKILYICPLGHTKYVPQK